MDKNGVGIAVIIGLIFVVFGLMMAMIINNKNSERVMEGYCSELGTGYLTKPSGELNTLEQECLKRYFTNKR